MDHQSGDLESLVDDRIPLDKNSPKQPEININNIYFSAYPRNPPRWPAVCKTFYGLKC
jgi:hypothetical protein